MPRIAWPPGPPWKVWPCARGCRPWCRSCSRKKVSPVPEKTEQRKVSNGQAQKDGALGYRSYRDGRSGDTSESENPESGNYGVDQRGFEFLSRTAHREGWRHVATDVRHSAAARHAGINGRTHTRRPRHAL